MDSKNEPLPVERTEDGYLIEIYTDERIAEFLAEGKLTAAEKKRVEEKLKQPKQRDS
ncbi:MAG TPA: hypothetical protein VLT81_04105 [Chondromyces sp.]|nr:hypothetical protein [Chondromyces sp.]